jgi:hypothetical protein
MLGTPIIGFVALVHKRGGIDDSDVLVTILVIRKPHAASRSGIQTVSHSLLSTIRLDDEWSDCSVADICEPDSQAEYC